MHHTYIQCLEEMWVVSCAMTGVGVVLCTILYEIRQKMAENGHVVQILK